MEENPHSICRLIGHRATPSRGPHRTVTEKVSSVANPNARPSYLIVGLTIILLDWAGRAAAETTRIQRPAPSPEEAQNIAVDIAKNDGLLREGDIIVTPQGFLVFKGVASDGYTNEFKPVPNPLNQNRGRKN